MTAHQAKLFALRCLDDIDPVMFSQHYLEQTGQGYDLGDVVKYDGQKFQVVDIHHPTQVVETRRCRS